MGPLVTTHQKSFQNERASAHEVAKQGMYGRLQAVPDIWGGTSLTHAARTNEVDVHAQDFPIPICNVEPWLPLMTFPPTGHFLSLGTHSGMIGLSLTSHKQNAKIGSKISVGSCAPEIKQ